jgi:SnoaL-like domain
MDIEDLVLRELRDRELIRELTHRYCFEVDRGTLDGVMSLFDDPCQLELVPGKRYASRDAVHRWYEAYMQSRMSVLRHLIHNQVITLEGNNGASSRCYFDAVGELKGESIVVAGFYEDQMRKRAECWRFAEKVIRLDFVVPLNEGWAGKKFKRVLIGNVD